MWQRAGQVMTQFCPLDALVQTDPLINYQCSGPAQDLTVHCGCSTAAVALTMLL